MHPTSDIPPAGPSVEDWERTRRSVAMLPPGAWALKREQALQALGALIQLLRGSTG